jgi:hypothetical protein
VFRQLLILRDGADFEESATGFDFRIFKDETVTCGSQISPPARTLVIHFVGGTVSLHDGYVRQVTIDEETNGRLQGSTVVYSAFDASPRVHASTSFVQCSAIPPTSPDGEVCRALVSK